MISSISARLRLCMPPRARAAALACLLALTLPCAPAGADEITPAGRALDDALDAMHVEQGWPAGQHVNWETGIPDGRPEHGNGKHTHCSAFAAAFAKRVGVYLLRPPEHSPVLLANAQSYWLEGEYAQAQGWRPVPDATQAQALANAGQLVLALYRSHDDRKPGHVAIVRAADKDAATLAAEGPQVTQAGASNYTSTSLRVGFSGHPAAWKRGEVRYYAHDIAPEALAAAAGRH